MRVDADDFARTCSCGEEHTVSAKEILIEAGAVERLEEMMDEGCLKEYISPLVICDTNTFAATEEIMEGVYDRCQVLTLEADGLCADLYAVEVILSNMEEDIDLILAVGAGTIHDLAKYVAHRQELPFVSVPTAASVDGFVSAVASVDCGGIRKSFLTEGPLCVICDTDIFAKAPARLTAAGASDLFAKYICLADWKIAHALNGEYFCREVGSLEKRALGKVRSCAKGLKNGDPEDCEELMYALVLSGLAMQMVGSSRPASGAEHHFSHLWDMAVLNRPLKALHGEKVGLGALICLREYKKIERAIREGRCKVVEYAGMEEELLQQTFRQQEVLDGIYLENTPDPLELITGEELEECLPAIAEILAELPEEAEMEELMVRAGCVTKLADIGLSEDVVPLSIELSPYVRNRLGLMRLRKMLVIEE